MVGLEAGAPARSTIAHAAASDFAAFIEPYLPKMRHLAERLAGAAYRDDVVQDALVNAWVSVPVSTLSAARWVAG